MRQKKKITLAPDYTLYYFISYCCKERNIRPEVDWTSPQVLLPKYSQICSGSNIIYYLLKKKELSERKSGWHAEEGNHISVTCAESIFVLTYTDYPYVEDVNTVITHMLILLESVKLLIWQAPMIGRLPIFVCIGDNKRKDYAMSAQRN